MPICVAVIEGHPLALKAVVRELDGLSAKTAFNYLAGVYHKLGIGAEGGVNPRVVTINKTPELGLLRQES